MCCIARQIETLRGISAELLRQLLDPGSKTPEGAAAVFQGIAPYLKAYSVYCGDFAQVNTQLERLAELRTREGWGSALEACMQDAERTSGQQLTSLLIKPVQRLCKYPLLLRELTRSLPVDDKAHAALASATKVIEEAVHSVNERVREVEGMAAIRALSTALSMPELITTSRALVRSIAADGSESGGPGVVSVAGRSYSLHFCTDLVVLTTVKSNALGGALALGGLTQWEGERTSLQAVGPLAHAQLEEIEGGGETSTLRLTLPSGSKAAAAATIAAASSASSLADAPAPSEWSYYLLVLPARSSKEALSLFSQLRSRDAASQLMLDRARTLRAQQSIKVSKQEAAKEAAPAPSVDSALAAAIARQYTPSTKSMTASVSSRSQRLSSSRSHVASSSARASAVSDSDRSSSADARQSVWAAGGHGSIAALERLAQIPHAESDSPAHSSRHNPPQPPPPAVDAPPPAQLSRRKSREQVRGEAKAVLSAVDELDVRVRRLSTAGSTLARTLSKDIDEGAGQPAGGPAATRPNSVPDAEDASRASIARSLSVPDHDGRQASRAGRKQSQPTDKAKGLTLSGGWQRAKEVAEREGAARGAAQAAAPTSVSGAAVAAMRARKVEVERAKAEAIKKQLKARARQYKYTAREMDDADWEEA